MRKFLLLPIILLIFFGCSAKKENKNTSSILIGELINKYPHLGLTSENKNTSFDLARSIKDKRYGLEFEWYEAKETSAGILIIKDSSNSYALPLFDREQYDFWEADTSLRKHVRVKVHGTFQQELKTLSGKLNKGSNWMFFRYLFEHVLLLRESCYPKPSSQALPIETFYEGKYFITMKLYKTKPDSITIKTSFLGVL